MTRNIDTPMKISTFVLPKLRGPLLRTKSLIHIFLSDSLDDHTIIRSVLNTEIYRYLNINLRMSKSRILYFSKGDEILPRGKRKKLIFGPVIERSLLISFVQ